MNYAINAQLLDEIIQYLGRRPYVEVFEIIKKIEGLPQVNLVQKQTPPAEGPKLVKEE